MSHTTSMFPLLSTNAPLLDKISFIASQLISMLHFSSITAIPSQTVISNEFGFHAGSKRPLKIIDTSLHILFPLFRISESAVFVPNFSYPFDFFSALNRLLKTSHWNHSLILANNFVNVKNRQFDA